MSFFPALGFPDNTRVGSAPNLPVGFGLQEVRDRPTSQAIGGADPGFLGGLFESVVNTAKKVAGPAAEILRGAAEGVIDTGREILEGAAPTIVQLGTLKLIQEAGERIDLQNRPGKVVDTNQNDPRAADRPVATESTAPPKPSPAAPQRRPDSALAEDPIALETAGVGGMNLAPWIGLAAAGGSILFLTMRGR